MMMKNVLFAVTLLSVALWSGCATGGGGHAADKITVTVSKSPLGQAVGVTLTAQFSADVKNTDNHAVTWSLAQGGTACTAACGTINSSGLYTAPAILPNPAKVDVKATSVANPDKSGIFQITVFPITVVVIPGPASVGIGLQQQLTAAVTPDSAPQTVTWAISATDCPANDCGTVNASGLYTAPNAIPSGGSFSIEATSTINPPNSIGVSNVTVVSSRLSGPYAFRFSGFDNNSKPVALAGNFVANTNGTLQSGVQDELTAAGHNHCTIQASGSSYTLDANNHGTLTLKTNSGGCAVNTRKYNFVLNAAGNGQMIEFGDAVGRGSGQFSLATKSAFNNSSLTGGFAFGLTGANIISSKRAGSAGFFVADGAGGIAATGSLDINDGGSITSRTGFDTALSQYSISSDGSGTLVLVSNGVTYNFAIYVVGGKTVNATNPLTLYMISTDPLANKPSVVGEIVFQDKTQTFDKSALSSFSVSNLTGIDTNGGTLVSLTAARGDSNGNISASYDANNAGAILAAKTFNSTYNATGNGRYTVDWLSPAVHFVLYLTAANRGFLLELDPSSTAVYTGTMDPQPGSGFGTSEMAGTFAAATGSSGVSASSQVAMNLLMTPEGLTNFTVAGTQDETDGGQNAGQTVAGPTNTMQDVGTGTITLTAPVATKYVTYALDNPKQSGFLILHFEMIDVDPANTHPTIIFAER